jgi:hypothetical protein
VTEGLFGPPLATADFDHDGHPDGALLLRSRNSFRIEVHLRSHLNKECQLHIGSR